MEIKIPNTTVVMRALLRADFTTQWRNRRSLILILLVPVIILISWRGVIDRFGAASVIANCITIGLIAIGLMGYTLTIGRDRDKGIFQRLRVGPMPSWCIMVSRLIVQLALMMLLVVVIFIAAYKFDNITLSIQSYVFGLLTSLIGGAVYLSLGQLIVGLIKEVDTVNSTTRLVYFVFIMVGTVAEWVNIDSIRQIVKWSPYGTVHDIVAASMISGKWDMQTTKELLATLGYTVVFATLGIRWFKWDTK